jgi:hypothetical protein
MALVPQGMANPNVPLFMQNSPGVTIRFSGTEVVPGCYDEAPVLPLVALERKIIPTILSPPGGEGPPTYEILFSGIWSFENFNPVTSASPLWIQISPSTMIADNNIVPLPPFNPATDAVMGFDPRYAINTGTEYLLGTTGMGVIRPQVQQPYSAYIFHVPIPGDTTSYYIDEGSLVKYRQM